MVEELQSNSFDNCVPLHPISGQKIGLSYTSKLNHLY